MEPQQILIVDDDPQVLRLFDRILKAGGYSIHAAASGFEAIQIVKEIPIDLVILDLSMPEPDGFEVLEGLRRMLPDLKVLVISGFLGGDLLRVAGHLGATAVLKKVEAPTKLLATVKQLLHEGS